MDAIEIYKYAKESIEKNKRGSERRINKIKGMIEEEAKLGKFHISYGLEEKFSRAVLNFFRDEGFDVSWDLKNQSMNISWDFSTAPHAYFFYLESMKEYKERLKVPAIVEFTEILDSLDTLLSRRILKEIRSLLKNKKTSFELEKLMDYEYEEVRKMLEMIGLTIQPSCIEWGSDYSIYKEIKVNIGAK